MTSFINNYAQGTTASGGALHIKATTNSFQTTFNGSVLFKNNESRVKAPISNARGGAIFIESGGILNFNATSAGDSVVFEDNYVVSLNPNGDVLQKSLNSIQYMTTAVRTNFNATKGAYVNIRDPFAGTVNVAIYKTGAGSMYLWGNNSAFNGIIYVQGGSFYAMFEENQTQEQQEADPLGQRRDFNYKNNFIRFSNNTFFRPMMSNDRKKLATLNTTYTNDTVKLVPYSLSSLDIGTYTFNNNTYGSFGGWSSSLAQLTTSFSNVVLEILRDLNGYDGLNKLADQYRKRENLSLMEREELDDLYLTGIVTDEFRDKMDALKGDDYVNYEQVHRSSVRSFVRQINSRVNNRNCQNCTINSMYSGQHFWFNASHNQIKKDANRQSLGYEYNPNGYAIGYDYDLIPNRLNVGVSLSYATGEAKTKFRSQGIYDKNDLDEYLIATYGKVKAIRPYFSWIAGAGLIKNDTHFLGAGTNAKGKYDTYAFFANVETGYNFGGGCSKIEPYIGVEYAHLMSESFNEKGNGARHFDKMDWDILEVPVGLRLSRDLFTTNYMITPAIDVAYARNFGDDSASTTAYFLGNAGNGWKVSTSSDKRDSLRGNINLKINSYVFPFALNIGYGVDYRTDYTDQQFYGTLRWDF